MTALMSTTDDLVSQAQAADLLGVDEDVVRLLVDAGLVTVTRLRIALGGSAPMLSRDELAAVTRPGDVSRNLSNARALWQYLTTCPPAATRADARRRYAPLLLAPSVNARGEDDPPPGLAVRVDVVPVWTLNTGEHKFVCTVGDLLPLVAPWEARRLVTLDTSESTVEPTDKAHARRLRQVPYASRQAPEWVARRVHDATSPTAEGLR